MDELEKLKLKMEAAQEELEAFKRNMEATEVVSAAANGNTSKVEELLSEGARVDSRDQGFTPLLAAAQRGHIKVFEMLLANGSDLEETVHPTLFTAEV